MVTKLLEMTDGLAYRRGFGMFFLTFTLKYDPMSQRDLSVDGIRTRYETLMAAVQYCWKRYLRRLGAETQAPGLLRKAEVSPRGAVHCHALFYGQRPDISQLRMLFESRAPGSVFVNIKWVKAGAGRVKAIKELAKYMTKSASPARVDILSGGPGEYLDPELAARVEFALFGMRSFEAQGCFRGMNNDDGDDDVEGEISTCPRCGEVGHWTKIDCRVSVLLRTVDSDWIPIFARRPPPSRSTVLR
jgi:hypothetical protein